MFSLACDVWIYVFLGCGMGPRLCQNLAGACAGVPGVRAVVSDSFARALSFASCCLRRVRHFFWRVSLLLANRHIGRACVRAFVLPNRETQQAGAVAGADIRPIGAGRYKTDMRPIGTDTGPI